jgi:Predicted membrane protein (DUF2207)
LQRVARVTRLACLLLVLLLQASASIAVAQQRSVAWDRYEVNLDVQSDASIQVTETQTIQFHGTYQQGFREIPTQRVTAIDSVSVGELNGGQTTEYRSSPIQSPNGFHASSTDQGLRIDWWFPPTTDGSRTFIVRYTVRGAMRVYDAGDQLEWKAVYADRPGDIAASSVTIRFPSDIPTDALKTSFYRYTADQESRLGALPSAGSGEPVDSRTVRFALGALPAGIGAEVRVQFPHGIVAATPPPWQAEADRADWIQQTLAPIGGFVAVLLTVFILAFGGVALFLLWYTTGRDPSPGTVPPRLDRRPSDLPAPLAGTLVDEVADVQDAVATLVDLAERGALVMTDEDNPRLAGSSHDVRVKLVRSPEAANVRDYERLLLLSLFGREARVEQDVLLSDVRERFSSMIPSIQDALHRAVAEVGLFVHNPEAVRTRYRRLAWGLVGSGVLLAVVGALTLGWAIGIAWLPGVALAAVGLILTRIARAMPRRTPAGAIEAARWRAFRAHLAQPDAPERASRPEDLAYAVAFGIDRSFLRRLESIGTKPPDWYVSPAGGSFGMPGSVVILPGGFGGGYGPAGGPWAGPTTRHSPGAGGFELPGVPNPQGWSDSLSDLLNGASDALGAGGGSGGWSGGGFGGGGGGGGGSGGFQ